MTDIVDGLYVRTATYGTPFHTALTCLRCGAMIDGSTYTPAPPRQVHARWHDQIDQILTRLADIQHHDTVTAEAVERDG